MIHDRSWADRGYHERGGLSKLIPGPMHLKRILEPEEGLIFMDFSRHWPALVIKFLFLNCPKQYILAPLYPICLLNIFSLLCFELWRYFLLVALRAIEKFLLRGVRVLALTRCPTRPRVLIFVIYILNLD